MATDFLYANIPPSQDGTIGFKNYGGSAIPAYSVVKPDTANAPTGANGQLAGVVVTAATTDVGIGITMEAIPAGGTGRVRIWGAVQATCTAGCTYGDPLMCAAAGAVATQTAGKPTIGMALNTAAAGDPVLVLLSGVAKNA